ncbi:isopentenyl-diphosphate Delta-isomerase [Pseudoflavitalea rhizosphaerae]|uniref:isopentenyl-diphosphate Delta-isomerase n=1 Tax=Pseudoflavitalea rhizosphaerae TaxID=1884793 RepID=UPI000F8E648F|nr:isopentenyl-diphosphate Delta-isomerase [Pseudoflavitalea rhizosphaerae]
MNGTQEVILVNERDEPIGTMEKIEAHRKAALHRAFSVFIFNSKGEMLLQQRALNKYHSAGLWTNACCSHPAPGEATADAAHRRLQEELGFSTSLEKIFDFTYQTAFDNGLIEHEFDHVFAGQYEQRITPNPEEVKDVCYKSLEDIQQSLQTHPQKYTSWFHIAFPKVKEWAVQQGLVQPTI